MVKVGSKIFAKSKSTPHLFYFMYLDFSSMHTFSIQSTSITFYNKKTAVVYFLALSLVFDVKKKGRKLII